jgi:hypothetical protein
VTVGLDARIDNMTHVIAGLIETDEFSEIFQRLDGG